MKKIIAVWILLKLCLLGIFAGFVLTRHEASAPMPAVPVPEPTVTITEADRIERPTSDPFKGDLSRYERENRAEKLQIERVMDLLSIGSGSVVADIGAGGGWFAAIASKRIGEKGKVYAVDINPDAIAFMDERKKTEGLENIVTVLGKEDDPLLAENSIDAVLILNTYHEIAEPVIYLKRLRPALRKNALVGIIDRNGGGDDHGVDRAVVVEEAERSGYRLKEEHDFVADSMDYFLIFRVKDPVAVERERKINKNKN